MDSEATLLPLLILAGGSSITPLIASVVETPAADVYSLQSESNFSYAFFP